MFSGVVALHIYGAISFFAYPFGAYFPCSVIFWMMSILVPFGMAMFQASNTQFLHVASRQKQLAHMSTLSDKKPISEKQAEAMGNNRFSRILSGVERADKVNRSLILIGVGMIVQVCLLSAQLDPYADFIVLDRSDIARIPWLREIPPWLWSVGLHSSRHRGGTVPQVQPRLGVVDVDCLAIRLGLDLRSLHDLEEQRRA